ncbi:hypothetical protein GCM10023238_26590 [Streptomyces heliomycini]
MSAATATATTDLRADARIPLRAHLRHTGALVRRNLLWIRQDPESMFDAVLFPIVFTLLFVYVFGGSIGQSLGGGQQAYVQYIVPGLMAHDGHEHGPGGGHRVQPGLQHRGHGPFPVRCRSGAARCCSRRSRSRWCGCSSPPRSSWSSASSSASTSPTGRDCSPPWDCPRCSAPR